MADVTLVSNLDYKTIYAAARPAFNALKPLMIALMIGGYGSWLIAKAIQYKNGDETIEKIVYKSLGIAFFFFFWPYIFTTAYMANDAFASYIRTIPMQVPANVIKDMNSNPVTNMDSLIQYMYVEDTTADVVKDEKTKPANENKTETPEEEQLKENQGWLSSLAAGAKDITSGNYFGKKFDGMVLELLGAIVQYFHEKVQFMLVSFIKLVFTLFAGITKDVMLLTRLAFASFFYCSVPFFLAISIIPYFGDTKSDKGVSGWSVKVINMCINMAFWPTFFAFVDMIMINLFYILQAQGVFADPWVNIAFFMVYMITIMTLPVAVHNANPYGVMHGAVTMMQTGMLMSAQAVIAPVSGAKSLTNSGMSKTAGSLAGAGSKSNSDNAGGEGGGAT